MTFVDTIQVIRIDGVVQPILIRKEEDLFYLSDETVIGASFQSIIKFTSTKSKLTIYSVEVNADFKSVFKLHQLTYCGLNSVRKTDPNDASNYICYTPRTSEFINWEKMAFSGLIETSKCEDKFSGLQ